VGLQITHRETMADVTEQTGAAVVTRGIFIPSGQKVPEGERKLGLLIQVPPVPFLCCPGERYQPGIARSPWCVQCCARVG
jgi:hypothetical protein